MACHSSPHASILPNLHTVLISSSTCNTFQASLSLSAELRHLQIDLGFKDTRRVSPVSDDIFERYLEHVAHFSPYLEMISFRGLATGRLNFAISSLQNVTALSLCLGTSLTARTLLSVTKFPRLLEFEVHAAHFDVGELGELFHDWQSPMFPSLRQLRIRAHAPVIELFLHALPADSLHSIHMEVEDPTCQTVSWAKIFSLICTKSANSLRNLTIEHHTELDDLDLEINNSINTHSITNHYTFPISFIDLQILGGIHRLRRFVLDTTFPANICDHELGLMIGWWPELEHLDLGSVPISHPTNSQPLSLRSLVVIAEKSTSLTSLILPIDISWTDNSLQMDLPRQFALTRLTCGYPFPSSHTVIEVANYLHLLFPSLQTVDGLSHHEEQWSKTQNTLHRLVKPAS
jgi:hypothetical protein